MKRGNTFKIDEILHSTDFYVIVYVQLIVMVAKFSFFWVALSTVSLVSLTKNSIWNTEYFLNRMFVIGSI